MQNPQHRAQDCQGRRVFLRRLYTLDSLSTVLLCPHVQLVHFHHTTAFREGS